MSATLQPINTNVKSMDDVRRALQQLQQYIAAGAYTPSGTAGGDLTGTYPNPTIATGAVTALKMASGAAASNVGALGGDLSGTLPSPTIAANAVSNAKAAQMAANTIKGNNTAGTANAADLTVAQTKTLLAITESDVANLTTDLAAKVPTARTISTSAPLTGGGDLSVNRTLAISAATATTSGAVPTPPNDITKFYRGDSTWAVPPSSGGITAYVQKSANYTVLSTDGGTFFDFSLPTSGLALTLPTGVPAGFTIWMRKADTTAHYLGVAPNAADGINGGALGSSPYAWGAQYYGACLTYTGTAGNGAGQGWIVNYWLIAQPAAGQVLKYDTVGTTPVWFGVNLAADVLGTLPTGNLPAFTGGDVTSSAGSGVLTIGAAKVTNAMLAASALAQILMRVCRGA